jgi:hypothetical protein
MASLPEIASSLFEDESGFKPCCKLTLAVEPTVKAPLPVKRSTGHFHSQFYPDFMWNKKHPFFVRGTAAFLVTVTVSPRQETLKKK